MIYGYIFLNFHIYFTGSQFYFSMKKYDVLLIYLVLVLLFFPFLKAIFIFFNLTLQLKFYGCPCSFLSTLIFFHIFYIINTIIYQGLDCTFFMHGSFGLIIWVRLSNINVGHHPFFLSHFGFWFSLIFFLLLLMISFLVFLFYNLCFN